jgi:hypothetical protein
MPSAEETAITNLTTATTALLESVNFSKLWLEDQVAQAVIVSENKAQIPLAQMAISLISINTLFVNNLTESA